MTLRNRTGAAALAAALLAGIAGASHAYESEVHYVDVPVLDVRPMIELVQVSTPQEICWNERVEYYVEDRPRGPRTSTIVGSLVGAAVGHNLARGDNRRPARIAGAVLGGAIGRDIGHAHAERRRVVDHERRCEVEYVSREEERIRGYRVTYRYDGRTFVTRTDHDPGDTLRLRVSVSPIR